MRIKQLGQKIPLLLFFLSITIGMTLYGLFASDDAFSEDSPRSLPLFMGIVCTFTSLLWFFVGSIDWSGYNSLRKTFGFEVDESEDESD